MDIMFDRVAGLDVWKDSVTGARTPGPRGGRRSETRTFKTMFGSLQVMRDWLVDAGVTIAAMESSTASHRSTASKRSWWWAAQRRAQKAVPGRKSDVRDVEWIAQLLEHGLLATVIRAATADPSATDVDSLPDAADGDRAEIVRLELMLEDASIKLSSVASSLKTVSARAMLAAMIEERPTRSRSPIWPKERCGARSPTWPRR